MSKRGKILKEVTVRMEKILDLTREVYTLKIDLADLSQEDQEWVNKRLDKRSVNWVEELDQIS